MTIESQTKIYLTVKQFASKYPWPSESGIRAIVLDADRKGFASAFKRFGRRVLVDPEEFFACLDRMQGKDERHVQR